MGVTSGEFQDMSSKGGFRCKAGSCCKKNHFQGLDAGVHISLVLGFSMVSL